MCGIVGYVGGRQAADVILDGLSRLEYRGYDSAGLVALDAGPDGRRLAAVKRAGKLQVLKDAVADGLPTGGLGLGHTRWATHGDRKSVV